MVDDRVPGVLTARSGGKSGDTRPPGRLVGEKSHNRSGVGRSGRILNSEAFIFPMMRAGTVLNARPFAGGHRRDRDEPCRRGESSLSQRDNEVFLLPLPQTYFTLFIRILDPDSFVAGLQLPLIDVAAPLGDEAFRLSP